jgi:hypothetical protein
MLILIGLEIFLLTRSRNVSASVRTNPRVTADPVHIESDPNLTAVRLKNKKKEKCKTIKLKAGGQTNNFVPNQVFVLKITSHGLTHHIWNIFSTKFKPITEPSAQIL